MKNIILVAALVASVVFSANAMPADIDTDGDGMASFAELQLAYPFLTESRCLEIDTDGVIDVQSDGELGEHLELLIE